MDTKVVDENRLAQEIVIFSDKSSIEEELTRLKSHINQFNSFVEGASPIGKKFDFLIQEMNREVNTIGSKANCLEITNRVIELKTEIENIREQIQNIEWCWKTQFFSNIKHYKKHIGEYKMEFVNIGFGNIVSSERIISIVIPDSAPLKRIVQEAKDDRKAIDATFGRRTRAVLIMDSGHIILSAVQPETIAGRLNNNQNDIEKEDV